MNLLEMIEKENMRTDIPEFKPGDSVKSTSDRRGTEAAHPGL
jgi:ribosomal protein L19